MKLLKLENIKVKYLSIGIYNKNIFIKELNIFLLNNDFIVQLPNYGNISRKPKWTEQRVFQTWSKLPWNL